MVGRENRKADLMDIPEAVRQAQLVMECVDQLEPEERLVLDILLEEGGGKLVKISDELDVGMTTAYRRKCHVLHRLSELFRENQVENPWNEMKNEGW